MGLTLSRGSISGSRIRSTASEKQRVNDGPLCSSSRLRIDHSRGHRGRSKLDSPCISNLTNVSTVKFTIFGPTTPEHIMLFASLIGKHFCLTGETEMPQISQGKTITRMKGKNKVHLTQQTSSISSIVTSS